jgi:hypothetical protein
MCAVRFLRNDLKRNFAFFLLRQYHISFTHRFKRIRNKIWVFLYREMIRNGISPLFYYVKNMQNFYFATIRNKIPTSFFCFARCFLTEFSMFLFRRNRRNFDETTVCFVLFHLSRNYFLNKNAELQNYPDDFISCINGSVLTILSFFSCASYSTQIIEKFSVQKRKKIIIYSLYFMLTSATTKYKLLGTYVSAYFKTPSVFFLM